MSTLTFMHLNGCLMDDSFTAQLRPTSGLAEAGGFNNFSITLVNTVLKLGYRQAVNNMKHVTTKKVDLLSPFAQKMAIFRRSVLRRSPRAPFTLAAGLQQLHILRNEPSESMTARVSTWVPIMLNGAPD
ncbi:hypothetical protein WDZ55_15525 [Pseudomonas bubulae]|uniref:hypothetical protein n=1 Tax=Pseudomonas bubulae TaxID=2316085 RepID=UPI00307D9AEF